MRFSTLFSGSSGNAIYIESDESSILVDAGLSGVRIQTALETIGRSASQLDAILVTHEHRDHICGVGVLSRRFDIPVLATKDTWTAMKSTVGKITDKNKICLGPGERKAVQDIGIDFFATSHDAVDPCGYVFSHGHERMGLLTDTGCLHEHMDEALTGCQCLVLEANHDMEMLINGPYPWHLKQRIRGNRGHLSNDAAGEALSRFVTADTCRVVLAHLSAENNLPELAMAAAVGIMEQLGRRSVSVSVAPRYQPLPLAAVGEE
ncbi:MBL fold metallo-hydrolase [Metallumcola ferriviriculae]|uniref:MBL fold metallo-hydrolase n=1 Tax=Metallumcola ferriviriculae TaxID=3039180 RepID=A0AAU0UK05_9FIRM|nr:MBL fold metallo-hydrolase [Desulfitibacteraceae bacterium MK1]